MMQRKLFRLLESIGNSMRILIDLTSLADNFSGIERYAACLAKEMIKDESIEFVLLFKNEVHPMFKNEINNTKKVVIHGCNKLIFNQVRLPSIIYKIKADYYLFLAFPVPVLLFKKNMISTIHDICCWDCPETMNGLSKWYFRISNRIALKKCKAIITISEFSKQRIVNKLKYDKNKVWLIYCGVDNKFLDYKKSVDSTIRVREKYELPNNYILSLSTLEPRKNLELLIKVYTSLIIDGKINVPLVLAGRKGWKMDEVLSEIDEIVREKILFTGFVEDEDLPAVYGNADLFVFPSMYEGFGMPPLEALACGTKVLSSNSTSLPEVLGDASIYFENMNFDSLYESLSKCNVDVEKSVMNNQVQKYSWGIEARKLIEYMRRN